jgi:hypothetical protein
MSDSNLSVRITADVVDLQTKFAIAQANVRSLTSEINKLASASAKGIIDPTGSARLQQVAGDLLHARSEAGSLAGALEKAGVSASSLGTHMGEAQAHVATTAREFRKLFTELKDGSVGGADVTILRLGQHLLGLGPAALVGVGAIAGLAGGLVYLAAKSIEASNALDHIAIGAQFAGNLDLTRDRIKQFADQMAQSAEISDKDALKIANGIARIPGVTDPAFQAVAARIGDFVAQTGASADQVVAEMKKLLGADTSAAKFIGEIAGATQAQINLGAAADRTGDAHQEAAAKIAAWAANLDRASAAVDQNSASIEASIKNRLAYTAAIASGLTPEEVQDLLLGSEIDKRTRNNQLLAQGNALLAAKPQTQEQTLKKGLEVADKENPAAKQIEEARAKVSQLNAALEVAESRADSVDVTKLAAGLEKANEELSALQLGPVLDQWREKMAQTAAAWDGTQSGLLAKQIQISQGVLANVQSSAKEQLAVKTEIAHLEVQQRQAAGADLISQARAEVALINGETALGGIQRLEAERAVWVQTLTGDQLTAAQRLEVAKTLAGEYAAINKETAAQAEAIARSDANTAIAISRLSIDAEKQALDQKLAAHQINASQKLAVLSNLTSQEEALNEKAIQAEIALLPKGTAAEREKNNQILELRAKLNLDLAALDRQAAAEAKKAADEEVTAWKGAVAEIEGAENTMIGDLLSGRKSFAASAAQAAEQLATKEIEDAARAVTTRLLLHNTEEAQTKALEQGGVLYHLLVEGQKTTTTAAGTTARASTEATGQATTKTLDAAGTAVHAAAEGTKTGVTAAAVTARNAAESNSGIFSIISRTVASWFGAETAKTGATAAGAGIRTTTQAAADVETTTAAKAAALSEINASAAVGAAAAGASVAAIPIYGWAAAAPTAAATYGELAAYASALTFDQGAWNIPGDLHGVTVHQGETILPRPFAEEFRANGGALGGGQSGTRQGGGNTYGDVNNHFHQVEASPEAIIGHITKAIRNGHPAFRGR